ncbi:MAG: Mce protein [Mycobacterium sp.]|nr:Mce protein [Mycobacterium sp.]
MADIQGRHSRPGEADAEDETVVDEAPVDEAADDEAADVVVDEPAEVSLTPKKVVTKRDNRMMIAMVVGLVVVAALGALVAWLGQRELQLRRDDALRQMYLTAGRQGAVNLTSIDYNHVEPDVQRVLDSATGSFYNDFQRRAASFTDVVKQMKSASVGTVTEAGVDSATDRDAVVLVAVTVHTDVGSGQPQPDRAWRVRLSMLKVGDGAKVSNVEFVQ